MVSVVLHKHYLYWDYPMPIKKKLIKELLKKLDEIPLKDLSESEVKKISEEVAEVVVKTVPVKEKPRLKVIKAG